MEEASRRSRRVAFEGAECIEYDADQPVVVRLCGVGRRRALDASHERASLELEGEARGIDVAACESLEAALASQYTAEIKQKLEDRGFSPLSDDLGELWTQLRAADLLLTWTSLGAGQTASVDVSSPPQPLSGRQFECEPQGLLSPETLRRTLLARKELDGHVDDGYAFGRRFLTIDTYMDTLERAELIKMAHARELPLPEVGEEERAAIKVPDRELLALRGSGAGKTLKQLTLRELIEESQAHGLDIEHEREGGAKKSKRAWIALLRVRTDERVACTGCKDADGTDCCCGQPLVHEDMVRIRVLMREEELLRELLAGTIEREAVEQQQQSVRSLIEQCVQRYQASRSDQPDDEPTTTPAVPDKAICTDQAKSTEPAVNADQLERYFAQLATALQPPLSNMGQAL